MTRQMGSEVLEEKLRRLQLAMREGRASPISRRTLEDIIDDERARRVGK